MVARSDRRAAKSFARTLLVHMLKLKVSPRFEARNGWMRTVRRCRRQIEAMLEEDSNLEAEFPSLASSEWARAVRKAVSELEQFGEDTIPLRSLTFHDIAGPNARYVLDSNHLPEPPDSE